jgi:group I intron endonuclease
MMPNLAELDFSNVAGIYQIKNEQNGCFYIGRSRWIRDRVGEHVRNLNRGCHPKKLMQEHWNEFGGLSFSFEVVFLCPSSDFEHLLSATESMLILKLKPAYNYDPEAWSHMQSQNMLAKQFLCDGEAKGVGGFVSPKTHQAIQALATKKQTSMRKLVSRYVEEGVSRDKLCDALDCDPGDLMKRKRGDR